jgi:hypothetical protein
MMGFPHWRPTSATFSSSSSAIARCARYCRPLSLLFGIDHFQRSTTRHPRATTCAQMSPFAGAAPRRVAARYGGEVRGGAAETARPARTFGEQIRRLIADGRPVQGDTFPVTTGRVAVSRVTSMSPFIKTADDHLYRRSAKAATESSAVPRTRSHTRAAYARGTRLTVPDRWQHDSR